MVSPSGLLLLFWRAGCKQERPPDSWPGKRYLKECETLLEKICKKKFDSKSSVCDKTTKIFREIIFNTVRWQRQLNAKGFFQTVLQNFYSIFFTKNKILIEIRRKIFDNKSTNRYLWENCKRILNQDLQTFLQISDFLFPYLNS